jgi:hypothetical protein
MPPPTADRPFFVSPGSILLPCLLVLALSQAGCGDTHAEPAGKLTAQFPAEIHLAGKSWVRSEELTAEDRNILQTYFRRHPLMVDNPLIAGDPVLYRHGTEGRRFYWFAPVEQETRWLALEFSRAKPIEMNEGSGLTFE